MFTCISSIGVCLHAVLLTRVDDRRISHSGLPFEPILGSDVSLLRGLPSQTTSVQAYNTRALTQTLEHRCEMGNIREMTSGSRATGASFGAYFAFWMTRQMFPQKPCVPSTVPSVQSQSQTLRGDRCLSQIFQRNSRVLFISSRAHSHTSSMSNSAWIQRS